MSAERCRKRSRAKNDDKLALKAGIATSRYGGDALRIESEKKKENGG